MGKEERQARKDDAAAKKAAELQNAHQNVTKKLDETGRSAAANNIRAHGGRWDSPEARNEAHGRNR
jgi:hypothetical protein